MITSNESLKTTLEKLEQKQVPKILVFGAPLNEIVHKLKTCQKKGRDETIKTVIDEQNKIINASANTEGRLGAIHHAPRSTMDGRKSEMGFILRWRLHCRSQPMERGDRQSGGNHAGRSWAGQGSSERIRNGKTVQDP